MEEPTASQPTELLRRYVESGDEAAFAALVGQFKGLVFSTALRRLGSVQLAEDAAQTTFAIIARKARALQNVTHHAAWIHRTTTQVARTIARSETRHRRKMKALIEHGDLGDGEDPEPWLAVHPRLDEALESLSDRDRQVLMLRFFDGLSFREVAEQVGKSEAAAQRQGHRAVEKLARRLRGKGAAAATVSLLAAGLGAQLAAPAPAAMATASLAQSALSAAPALGSGTLFANTIYTMSQAKTLAAAAAVILIALVPLGMQRAAIAKAKRSIALLEVQQDRDSGRGARVGAPSALSKMRGDRSPDGVELNRPIRLVDWLDELEAFMDGGDLDKVASATGMLNSLPHRERAELEALLADAQTIQIENSQLRDFVMQALCEKIAVAHLDLAFGTALSLDPNQFGGKAYAAGGALASHVDVDPAAAVDAYFEEAAAGKLGPPAGEGFAVGQFRNPVLIRFFERLYEVDKTEAERLFDGLVLHDRRVALASRSEVFGDRDKRAPLIELALRAPDAETRLGALDAIADSYGAFSGYGTESLDLVRDLTERGELSPEEGAGLLVSAVKHFLRLQPENAIVWIGENTPPEFVESNLARAREYRDAHAAERGNR